MGKAKGLASLVGPGLTRRTDSRFKVLYERPMWEAQGELKESATGHGAVVYTEASLPCPWTCVYRGHELQTVPGKESVPVLSHQHRV